MRCLILALLLPLVVSSVEIELPVDCDDLFSSGHTVSGVFTIYPSGYGHPLLVYCDMACGGNYNDGLSWTVIQRRMDGTVNFYQPWDQYKKGFGNKDGEYWLGLEWLHQLTSKKRYELRVNLEDFEGKHVYAHYSSFSVGSEADGYRLQVSGYIDGGAGDALTYHSGNKFTTFDRDRDLSSTNCALHCFGAFWYNNCHYANLNGVYMWGAHSQYAHGIIWNQWKGYYYSLKSVTMKIRLVS